MRLLRCEMGEGAAPLIIRGSSPDEGAGFGLTGAGATHPSLL